MAILFDGLTVVAAIWAGGSARNLTLLFATGFSIEAWNRRHPQRKISPKPPPVPRAVEMRRSVEQLAVMSACIATGLTLQWHGRSVVTPLAATRRSVPLMRGVSVLCPDARYYFMHRIMHTRALYRFHKPHHLSVVPSPRSTDASGTVDVPFVHGYYAVAAVLLPIPLLAHRTLDAVTAMIGHAAHEHMAGPTGR